MNTAENIERIIRQVAKAKEANVVTSQEMDKRILDGAINAYDASRSALAVQSPHNIGRIIMKSSITRFAVAVVIIIAVIVGVHYSGGSIDGTSVAWGDVVKKVEQIETFTYRMRSNITGAPNRPKGKTIQGEIRAFNSSEYGIRTDMYTNDKLMSITYMYPPKNTAITVVPAIKKYMRMILTDGQIQELRNKDNPREIVRQFTSFGYKELGSKMINGVEVKGIEINDPKILGETFETFAGNLWVDVKTDLPVLMDFEASSDKGAMKMNMTFDDFKWDVQIAPSVFEPNIPSDYTLMAEVQTPDASDEGKAIQGLRIFAEMANGKYPTSLSLPSAMKEFGEVLKKSAISAEKADPNAKPTQEQIDSKRKEFMEKMFRVQTTCAFYARLVKDRKDPAYYGDEVTTADSNSILMRWTISDNQYRIIYGSLITEDVNVEKLTELKKVTK